MIYYFQSEVDLRKFNGTSPTRALHSGPLVAASAESAVRAYEAMLAKMLTDRGYQNATAQAVKLAITDVSIKKIGLLTYLKTLRGRRAFLFSP